MSIIKVDILSLTHPDTIAAGQVMYLGARRAQAAERIHTTCAVGRGRQQRYSTCQVAIGTHHPPSLYRINILDTPSEQLFSIGAVVKFTGLTSHAIRVWEKRHNAVEPKRLSNGRRMYTQKDINRLSSLKQCIALGKSISSIAQLSDAQLSTCLSELKSNLPASQGTTSIPDETKNSLALFGSPELLNDTDELTELHISTLSTDRLAFIREVTQLHPNIIIMEIPSLSKSWVDDILSILTQATPDSFIVIYRFANHQSTETLYKSGITLMRAPLSEGALNKAILNPTLLSKPPRTEPNDDPTTQAYPKRIFTPEQLNTIKNVRSKLDCECPHHLVELINGLATFEQYSGDCINENEIDAALHANIQRRTAQARQDLENVLQALITHEELTL